MAWADLGDPEALREQGRQLRAQADQVRGLADWTARRLDGMTFEGPAARRLEASSHHNRGQAHACAARIDELADLLDRGAGRAEEERAAFIRRQEEEARWREAEAREWRARH